MTSETSNVSQHDVVQGIIYRALQNLNAELPPNAQVAINKETLLLGENSLLDSLSLVSVIIDVETAVQDELARTVSLTDDRAMSHQPSPYVDVRALLTYILLLLSEQS